MKIAYVAMHANGDNDDEGAIAHALRQLGHDVQEIHERRRHRRHGVTPSTIIGDFCLFHKWPTISELMEVQIPRCFWYFDLVDGSEDFTLKHRAAVRMQWFRDALPHSAVGFCTDGDWVAQDESGKLVHLMQGCDERFARFGKPNSRSARGSAAVWGRGAGAPPIVFTGLVDHGRKRVQHLERLQSRYGDKFQIIGGAGNRGRLHRYELADYFASTKIVVAPDGPSTDRYWSNRVYLTLSLGGFLLHPWCAGLAQQYKPGEELVFYRSRDELEDLIDYYLHNECEREELRLAGHKATLERHTYRHRCEELIQVVKGRI